MERLSTGRVARLTPIGTVLKHEARFVAFGIWQLLHITDAKRRAEIVVRIAPQDRRKRRRWIVWTPICIEHAAAACISLGKNDGLGSAIDKCLADGCFALRAYLPIQHVRRVVPTVGTTESQMVGCVTADRPKRSAPAILCGNPTLLAALGSEGQMNALTGTVATPITDVALRTTAS